jgi:hypothetical protein
MMFLLLVQVGPTAGINESISDAVVTFTGAMVGPCTFYNDAGAAFSQDCTSALINIAAQYFVDPSLFTSSLGGSPLIDSASVTSSRAVSGVVTLQVSGGGNLTNSAFKCQSSCSSSITIPLNVAVNSTNLVCLRIEQGSVFSGYPTGVGFGIKAAVVPASTAFEYGAATCDVTRAGTYFIAEYTPTPEQGAGEGAPADTTAYSYEYVFQADYLALSSSPEKMAAFKLSVQTAIATAAKLPLANIAIKSIKAGSVVVSLDVAVPKSWTAEEINAMDAQLASNPGSIFTQDFLTAYGITGVSLKRLTELPPLAKAANAAVAIGVGVGVGVGAALLIAVVVAVLIVRRRRMHVSPNAPNL